MNAVVPRRRKALLIGINYLASEKSRLRGCINDVRNSRDMLVAKFGFLTSDIVTLSDDVPALMPTRANILAHIRQLVAAATPTTSLFLHYSGHGSWIRDTSGDERETGMDEVIVPADYARSGFITDDELRATLVDPLPAGCKLTCVFDCCNSGTALDLRCVYKSSVALGLGGPVVAEHTWIPRTACTAVLISGCRDDQTSADTVADGKPTGAMTYALLNVLQRSGYVITYAKLMEQLVAMLRAEGFPQVPQLSFGQWVDVHANFSIA